MVGKSRGACAGVDPPVLMPLPGDAHAEAVAKRLCGRCDIRAECLNIGIHTTHLQGVWGGLTARERLGLHLRRSTPVSWLLMPAEAPVLGVALGGGAVRGLAHLGALRAFARSGLCPDVICGTSSGAIIAGAIASGSSADELIHVALRLRWSELLKVSVRHDRLFDTSGLDDFIASVIPARSFDDLHIAFASIAQDRLTGERVVLKRGDPSRAAAASAAIRRAFPPVNIDGRLLIDGCDVEPVPVRAARELGATYVVGIDVLRTKTIRRSRTRVNVRAEGDADGCDLTITPALGSRSAWDFSKTSEIIALGESAADSAVEAIKTALTVAGCGSA